MQQFQHINTGKEKAEKEPRGFWAATTNVYLFSFALCLTGIAACLILQSRNVDFCHMVLVT